MKDLVDAYRRHTEESKARDDEVQVGDFIRRNGLCENPAETFLLLPEAIRMVVAQNDRIYCVHALDILYEMADFTNTTELPPEFLSNWPVLVEHVSEFGSPYMKSVLDDLRRLYRM